jgi:hypothetical protein
VPNRASASLHPTIPPWIVGFAVLASLLLAMGAGISLFAPQRLAPPGVEINAAAHVYAGYTFSRDLSLLVVMVFALLRRSRTVLSVAIGMFSLMNCFDAVMDVWEGRYPIVAIAVLLAVVAALAYAKTSSTPHEPAG